MTAPRPHTPSRPPRRPVRRALRSRRLLATAAACLTVAALTTGAAAAAVGPAAVGPAAGAAVGPAAVGPAAVGPTGAVPAGSRTAVPAGGPPATTAPARPGPPSSPGCGTAPAWAPGTTAVRTLDSGGLQRTVRVHLPDGYRADRPTPVVLVFHGRGNDGATTENVSGLSGLPAVVAYPDGVPGGEDKRAWQGAPYSAPGVDDVVFTGSLLDELESTLCVDPGRVFATGKSNGGGFTEILACRMSDRIAAIAPVAGAYYRAGEPPCRPGRPVPALFVHGTDDATIPYTGDADRGLPAIPAKVAEWVARDGCHARPQTRRIEPDVTIATWRGCRDGARVSHVAVDVGGHTWPGATAYSGGGVTTQTVRATALVGDFFGLGGRR
ncbi:PHB depolymerase family esterase [Pseudonocardia sp. ICBG1293]|uniref:alpha/beta hydrolase family esterase n=1 Tax=Pseudonocardia sp. ICBG1293 TaxID=2844382 RepID=UPI001CCCE5F6|nr:poly(3-hydroxybutyrate) depolymerase [Pseudonocardia sp. ICBG1293]